MSLIGTVAKVVTAVSGAAKAYSDANKKKNSTSSSSSSSSSSNRSTSSSSGYVGKGSNSDSYIKDSNIDDYNAIQSAKRAYAEAQSLGDEAGMKNANAAANAVRAKYGYSGGSDGSEYIPISSNQQTSNPYEDAMREVQARYDKLAQQQKEANALAVKQGTQRLENQKSTVNQSYDDSARQAYIANMQSKKNLPQQLAAAGVNGGTTESANLGLQTSYENNLNDINMNRANAINDIDNAIIELRNNGDLTAAQQALDNSQQALAAYQNLLGNKINYDISNNEKNFNAQLSTLGQYSDDYQAEINRRMESNPNDPLIPYLVAARQEKINAQRQAEIEANNAEAEQQRELAWKLFQETGRANNYVESVLGIPAGTTTLDYAKNQYDAALNNARINNYNSSTWKNYNSANNSSNASSSASKNSTVSYSTHKGIIDNLFREKTKDDYDETVYIYDAPKIQEYIASELDNGRLSETDAQSLAKNYGVNYYRSRPEYQIIMNELGKSVSKEQGLEKLQNIQKTSPDVDTEIFRQIYNDWEAMF